MRTNHNNDDSRTIEILDSLIVRYKEHGLGDVMSDCNDFGCCELNFLYTEIYKCITNDQPLLALSGAGMFLEQFTNELWVSNQIHEVQKQSIFNTWDEMMIFLESQYKTIEEKEVDYTKDILPILEKVLEPEDLEAIVLFRRFIRNTFVHSKRVQLLDTLRKNKVLPDLIPVGRMNINSDKFPKMEQVELSITHPLLIKMGFMIVARQLSPAMLIFIFKLFSKYHKIMAPLKDDKIGYVGHICSYCDKDTTLK